MLQVQEIEIEKLHPWEDNPRLHDHAVDAVAESIRSFGFNVPILCNTGKDEMVKIKDDSQYRDFDQYVKHLIDTLRDRHGFDNKVINWYRGADGNVIYAGFEISPQGAS